MATCATQPPRTDPGSGLTVALIEWAEARRRGDHDAEYEAVETLRGFGVYLLVHLPGRSGPSPPALTTENPS